MSEQSLSVIFKSFCDVAPECEVSIEYDDILNGGVTTFQVGSQIFYRVFPVGNYAFYLSNGGMASIVSPKKLDEMSEEIVFSGDKEVNLTCPLDSSFTYDWVGSALEAESPHSKCIPKIIATVGSTILTVKEPIYGIIKVTYKYSYASIKFIPMHSGKQIVLVCKYCEGKEVCAYMIEDIEDQFFDDVTLTISDACESGLKVEGAQVEVNGELIELVSGVDGKIHVGLLAKGTHSIKVTAPGYVSSDEDGLSNDEIIVE